MTSSTTPITSEIDKATAAIDAGNEQAALYLLRAAEARAHASTEELAQLAGALEYVSPRVARSRKQECDAMLERVRARQGSDRPDTIVATPETVARAPLPKAPPLPPTPSAAKAVPNPIGLGIALLGGALVIVGAFTPVHTYGNVPVIKNSFVAGGQWWILVAGIAMAAAAAGVLMQARNRDSLWGVAIPSVIAIGGGIYGLSSGFQKLGLTPLGQEVLGGTSVKATPGIGVYLVLAGGIVGLVGTLIAGQGTPARPPAPTTIRPQPSVSGLSGELERLSRLHTQGALTDLEFADAKQRALRDGA